MSRRRGTHDAGAHSHSHSHDDASAGLGILNHGFDDVPRDARPPSGSHAGHSHSHSHHDDADDISPLTRQVGAGQDDSSPESSSLSPTTPAANGFGHQHPPAPSSPFLPLYPPTEPHGKASSSTAGPDDTANHSESYDALPPLSPLPTRGAAARLSAAEVKAQRHERIHSRNLSIFFPRPGAPGPRYN